MWRIKDVFEDFELVIERGIAANPKLLKSEQKIFKFNVSMTEERGC